MPRNGSAAHFHGGPWFMVRVADDGWAEINLANPHRPTWLERLLATSWRRIAVALLLLALGIGLMEMVTHGAPRWLAWPALASGALALIAIYFYPLFKGMVANFRLGGRATASALGRRPRSVDKLAGRAGTMRVFHFADVSQVGLTTSSEGSRVAVVTFRDGGQISYESGDDLVYQLLSNAFLHAQGGLIR